MAAKTVRGEFTFLAKEGGKGTAFIVAEPTSDIPGMADLIAFDALWDRQPRCRMCAKFTQKSSMIPQRREARHIRRDILQDRFSRGRHRQGGVRGTAQILNA